MIDEIKLGQVSHKGSRAAELLGEGSVFNDACADLENRCMEQWRNAKAFETAEREDAWRTIKALDAVRTLLKAYVINGRIAASDLVHHYESTERARKARRKPVVKSI